MYRGIQEAQANPPHAYRAMVLSFSPFMEERDRCRNRTYESQDPILREGYFCNTDRRWDFTSEQQEYEDAH